MAAGDLTGGDDGGGDDVDSDIPHVYHAADDTPAG
jgi:hypothetical protein